MKKKTEGGEGVKGGRVGERKRENGGREGGEVGREGERMSRRLSSLLMSGCVERSCVSHHHEKLWVVY